MDPRSALTDAEQVTTIVFGDTFALYGEDEFDEFIEPFHERLRANGISPEVFRGARCLDAGCGGGRASVMMAQCGAAEVVGYDLSERNIETSRARARHRGLDQCSFVQGSLLDIPFEDASFDIVWCNGVLHHTEDPDKGLAEITRVLRPGGRLWLYLYGSGGIYWFMADWVRALLSAHDVRDCIYQLRLMSIPVRRIAEWIDDWFSPYLRRYTVEDVRVRLEELGYSDIDALHGGTVYDTSQRRISADDVESQLMGEGDVRFFSTKVGDPVGMEHPLPDPPDLKGSPYVDGAAVLEFVEPLELIRANLEKVEARSGSEGGLYRVAAASSVHAKVRSLLETDAPFDTVALHSHLADLAATLDDFARGV
jgi:ubiquinone/menaquinone biosynthesis C-methylase UbiE